MAAEPVALNDNQPNLLLYKVWYTCYFGARAFVSPYVMLYVNRLGYNPGQVGALAMALAVVSKSSSIALSVVADKFSAHRLMMGVCMALSVLCTICIAAFPRPFVLLVLEILGMNVTWGTGIIIGDTSTVSVVEHMPGGYGRYRLWGAVGWGALSLVAGWVLGRFDFAGGVKCFVAVAVAGWWIPLVSFDFRKLGKQRCGLEQQSSEAGSSKDTPRLGAHRQAAVATDNNVDVPLLPDSPAASEDSTALLRRQDISGSQGTAPVSSHADEEGAASGRESSWSPPAQDNGTGAQQRHTLSSSTRPALLNGDVMLFLVQAMLMGYGTGTYDTYLFVYMDQLHAPTELMSLSITFMTLAEVPVFHFASQIVDFLGHRGSVCLIFAAQVVRLLAYSSMALWPTLWLVLLVEPLHGLTFALAWDLGTQFMRSHAPKGLEATMQSIYSFCNSGLGRGLGGLVGGIWYSQFGLQQCFIIQAAIIAVLSTLSFCFWRKPAVA